MEPACGKPMGGSYVTTHYLSGNATAWVPFVIPTGFTGIVTVEADLTVPSLSDNDQALISLGFLTDEDCEAGGSIQCSFAEMGDIRLEQTAAGVNFYDANGIVGVMDWPNWQPTVRHWKLSYNYGTGQLSATLTGGGTTTFGGPIAVPAIRAVGFEIFLGTAGLSGVDNFKAEVIPGFLLGGM